MTVPRRASGLLRVREGVSPWSALEADLDAALADGPIDAYLADAADNSDRLVSSLSVWIFGALMLTVAASPDHGSTQLIR